MTVTPINNDETGWAAGFPGDCVGWRRQLPRRNPAYRRRHDEQVDHARGESDRDNRERWGDRSYGDRTLNGKTFKDNVIVSLIIDDEYQWRWQCECR